MSIPPPLAVAPAGELSTTPRPPTLAEQLLTQTLGECPVLADAGEREQLLAATWLAGHRSAATRRAYAKDLAGWLDWLAQHRVDVLAARTLHVELWTRAQLDAGAAAASVNRRLAGLSSFYAHCAAGGLTHRAPKPRECGVQRVGGPLPSSVLPQRR